MDIWQWETEVYPKIWHAAYDLGVKAREEGLPRECNLDEEYQTLSGQILTVWLSAWNQGWDGYKIPEEFRNVEANLNQMPLRPMTEADLE